MKVINEKGKIFGKLNIIDLIVVILVIVVLAALAWKTTGSGGGSLAQSTKLTYTVKVANVEKAVYESILDKIPGQLMASGDMLDGNVIAVDATLSEGKIYDVNQDENGEVELTTGAQETYDLIFTLEANVKNTVLNEVGTQEVRIGKQYIVKTTQFELEEGVVLTCDWETPA